MLAVVRDGAARRALADPLLAVPFALGLALLTAGMLLADPPPSAAQVAVAGGAALLAVVLAAVLVHQLTRTAAAADSTGLGVLGERLERGIERLHDLQWELSDNEARYRDLLDSHVDIITRFAPDGRLTFVNRAFCRTFGVEAAAVLGKPFAFDVLEHEGEPADRRPEPGRRLRFEQLLKTADGARWLAYEQHAITGEDGAVEEIQLVGRDVTDQRRTQAALAEARDQAEAANRAKSRFLAAMSHEIRTPMNGILGMTSLMLETPLTAEQRSYIAAVDHSAKNLLSIIDEILDLSKIEAGKLEIHPAPFELDDCVQGVVELLAPRAREKGLDLAWRIEPELPKVVVGDETRVRQVLLNLIGNAIKFTDAGGVCVRVGRGSASEAVEQSAAPGSLSRLPVAIEVTDTGPGITSEQLKSLFTEFEQPDEAVRRKRSGTGLGLAISRRLAHAMHGDIDVASEPARGSVFTARLVLAASGERVPSLARHQPDRPSRLVLIVSDRPLQAALMLETLLSMGIPGEIAAPDEALAAVDRAKRSGLQFDTVVCDVEDGPDQLRRLVHAIRADGGRQPQAILVVDQPGGGRLEPFRAAGCNAYLVRPVRPASLLTQIDRDWRDTPASSGLEELAPAELPASPKRLSGRSILIVEDNAINALLATRMSEKVGCLVHHAPGGAAAIEHCARLIDEAGSGPDLVLMDIHMPDMDGYETARHLKRLFMTHGLDTPPIVALTANAFAEDRLRCFEAGLDDYLAKPFERSELEALLERWCPTPVSSRDGRLGSDAA